MIVLMVKLCLLASLGECKWVQVADQTTMPELMMMSCVVGGQAVVADWLRKEPQPNWSVQGYRCGPRRDGV